MSSVLYGNVRLRIERHIRENAQDLPCAERGFSWSMEGLKWGDRADTTERDIMEQRSAARGYAPLLAALMIGVQRAISLFTNAAA
jgi:hypothetical protein